MLPLTRAFAFKRMIARLAGIEVGEDVCLVSGSRFWTNGKVKIGAKSWVGYDFLAFGGKASIEIGENCGIGPRVVLATGSHSIEPGDKVVYGEGRSEDIFIGEGCWIGANVTVLGGTVIGDRVVVAAGAVVKGCFRSDSVIGGVPARELRSLRQVRIE